MNGLHINGLYIISKCVVVYEMSSEALKQLPSCFIRKNTNSVIFFPVAQTKIQKIRIIRFYFWPQAPLIPSLYEIHWVLVLDIRLH